MHKDAYLLMKFATPDGKEVEWIWNSTDQAIPQFVPHHSGKLLSRVQPQYAQQIRDYKPLSGERVFAVATEENIRNSVLELVENNWFKGRRFDLNGSKECALQRITADTVGCVVAIPARDL